jgi:wobble nucleotide-excising tRNase
MYRQSFDTAYEEHDKSIKRELSESQLLLTKERINSLKIIIESNNTLLLSYPELEDDKNYSSIKEQITLLIKQLDEFFIQWSHYQIEFKEKLDIVISQKQASPHKALEIFQFNVLLRIDEEIKKLAQQYSEYIIQTNRIFQSFKTSVTDESLIQRLAEITGHGKAEKRKLQRLELAEQCKEYSRLDLIISYLKGEIPRLENELLNEQSNYLSQYFDRLNNYFRLFGSNDFQLEKSLDTRGHKPIYYLKVKFHGVDISEKNLDRVFSESDRRSLALAVFWASLSGLNDIEKKNTIVVLDDPVTSFDNHRISSVHREIVSISENFRQIILLSHFEQGISTFLNTYSNNKPIKLLLIEKTDNSSEIKEETISNFIRNSHEKARDNIFNFVSGKTNIHNASALRVFLEIEINHRFAKQIISIDEGKLSNRIDKLKDINAISEETASEVHRWREQLNPEHHIWMGGDLEDQRRTAEQFMDFIYYRLIPLC